jgi:hypothetical protein
MARRGLLSRQRSARGRLGAFRSLARLCPDEIGAQRDEFDPVPFLRFDDDAQALFKDWRKELETELRSGELSPALESHLAKYRKLVPALALINHLAEGGVGPIGEKALLQALAAAEYLKSHAKRAYGAGQESDVSAAKAVLDHIRKGDLRDGFTAREVHQRGWANLSKHENVQAGLGLLCDLDWLRTEKIDTGGRPSARYHINPRAYH